MKLRGYISRLDIEQGHQLFAGMTTVRAEINFTDGDAESYQNLASMAANGDEIEIDVGQKSLAIRSKPLDLNRIHKRMIRIGTLPDM